MAFTPTPTLDIELLSETERLELDQLTEEALRKAFDYICHLYECAYGFPLPSQIAPTVFSLISNGRAPGTRTFMKTGVEALDLLRFHGVDRIGELLR